jgi:hypothetical protein
MNLCTIYYIENKNEPLRWDYHTELHLKMILEQYTGWVSDIRDNNFVEKSI